MIGGLSGPDPRLDQGAYSPSPRDPMITLWYTILAIEAFISERHDEAVDWATAAIRAQPNRNTAYLDLSANPTRRRKPWPRIVA